MGAGLLVGTALAVIIPEGVHTLYDAHGECHFCCSMHGSCLLIHGCDTIVILFITDGHVHTREVVDGEGKAGPEASGVEPGPALEMHSWIGVALVLGFVFMLLVDQLGGGNHVHAPLGQ